MRVLTAPITTVEYSTLWRHEVCPKRWYLTTKLYGVILICWRLINSIAVFAQWRRHHGAVPNCVRTRQLRLCPRIYCSGVGLCGTALSNGLLPCVWSIGRLLVDGKVEVLRNTCFAGIPKTKPLTWTGLGLNSLPLLYALFFAVMVIVNESCFRGTKMSGSGYCHYGLRFYFEVN